jgi:hypothetical protein
LKSQTSRDPSSEAMDVMHRTGSTAACEELQWICKSTLHAAFPSFRAAEIVATFYPYIGLTHTFRHRGSKWVMRVSDHCQCAPRQVLEAITIILACKVMRRCPPQDLIRTYRHFSEEAAIQASVRERRRFRGKKLISVMGGASHSLSDIFQEVNRLYFNDQIEVKTLGWGTRISWARLGHYDPIHHTITISPALDSPRVPRFVVAFVVYHEMLHGLFFSSSSTGQMRHHPPEFRRAEKSHPDYLRAKKFLTRYCQQRKC